MKKTVKNYPRRRKEDNAKKVLGITANIKNMMIAAGMLVAFLGIFWNVYNWAQCEFAKQKELSEHITKVKTKFEKVETIGDYRWETTVLNGMYSRYYTLDNMIIFAGNLAKVPPEIRSEYNDLKGKIKLQEERVKILQERTIK